MPRTPAKPAALRKRMFRGSDVVNDGLLTKEQLKSTAWRRLFKDVYVDRAANVTHWTRCAAACTYLLPEGAVITGRSAARIYGIEFMPDHDPVEVLVPAPFGPVTGLKILFGQAAEDEILRRADRIRVAMPLRVAWDLTQLLKITEAVIYLDAMLARHLVKREQLVEHAWRRSGDRGWSSFLAAVNLTDAGAESPQESRLRVGLVRRGFPKPVTQHVITRDGLFVARVDLAWPELKVAVEYDGRWHADAAQLERDRARLNRLVGAEWTVLHITADRMRTDFEGFVRELAAALKIAPSSLKKV